ncbi:MAG: DUF4230 domain-containing protein [Lachnospiraceae bacterium]|nr:DUF4230 domain-containing protein [Lachnospiraceae bacterium]
MRRDTGTELDTLINRKARLIKFAIILVVLLAIVLAVFIKGYISAKEKYENQIEALKEENERLSDPIVQYEVATRDVSIEQIEANIQDIGELATVEYLYTDAGKFEDPAVLFGKEIPFSFTTKSFIAKWDGVIKAGIEIDKVTVELSESDKEIIVHIPKAKILSHEIDDDSIETLDEKNGLFNPIKIDDIREFDVISKDAMEQRAIENGLLDKAYENAKGILYKIINTGVVEELEYTVTFEVIEE